MVLVTQRAYLIPRIQAMNVGAVMVLLNELSETSGTVKCIILYNIYNVYNWGGGGGGGTQKEPIHFPKSQNGFFNVGFFWGSPPPPPITGFIIYIIHLVICTQDTW